MFLHLPMILLSGGGVSLTETPAEQRTPDRDPLERDHPRQRPPWTGTTQTETPRRAGDTHPTGMHSCYHLILLYLFFKSENSTVSEWM